MRSRARVSVILAAAVAAAVPAADAYGCSCAPQSASETYRQMPAAFTGRLLGVSESADGRFAIHRYRVRRDYKRNLRDTIRVRAPGGGNSCGISEQEVGNRYSMFLFRSEDGIEATKRGRWTTNACLQTTRAKLRRASEEAESSGAPDGATGCTGAA